MATLNAGEGGPNIHIGFSSDGSVLFVSTATSVHAWSLSSFTRIGDYGPFGRIISMSGNGDLVISEATDGKFHGIEVTETLSRKVVCQIEEQGALLVDAAFDARGRRLVTLARDNQAKIWDIPKPGEQPR